jgi:phage-related protein (TIGR01555 family)
MSGDGGTVERLDGWVNLVTGLGTARDKLTYAKVSPGERLSDASLETLFNEDDTARRVVSKLPREAMRRGFRVELEADDGDDSGADVERELHDQLRKIGADAGLRDGWIWARLYGGGSGLFVGADDGRQPDEPLNEAGIRTIAFVNVIKRPQVIVKRRYADVTKPDYGKPEIVTIYQNGLVTGAQAAGSSVDVHVSRLILFDGVLTARTTQPTINEWDDSVLQSVYAALQQSATGWQSTAHLMTDAAQGVLKIQNLIDLTAAGRSEVLQARMQAMDMARSVARAIIVDAEKESFERIATSFSGLPEVLDKLMTRVASAAEMPVTLLYGRSPAGLNATGESDIRGWYDTVADAQTDVLEPRLQRLLTLMFLAKDGPTSGVVPERWCIEFNPLWQPTDKELADTNKVKADTYVALVGAQIVTESEAAIGLAPDFPVIDVDQRKELQEEQADVHAEALLNPPDPNADPNADADPAADSDARTDAGDNQPRDYHGRWTVGGSLAAARARTQTARIAYRTQPTADTRAAHTAAAAAVRQRRSLDRRVRSHGGGRETPRPKLPSGERRAFIAPHRQALAAAQAAHAAQPTGRTARAVTEAHDALRQARRLAGSSHLDAGKAARDTGEARGEQTAYRGAYARAELGTTAHAHAARARRLGDDRVLEAVGRYGSRRDVERAATDISEHNTSSAELAREYHHAYRERRTGADADTPAEAHQAAKQHVSDVVHDVHDVLHDTLIVASRRLPKREAAAHVRTLRREALGRARGIADAFRRAPPDA